MSIEDRDRRARIGFGVANVAVAIGVLFGVFKLLPTRWLPVDAAGLALAALFGASGVMLLRKMPQAEKVTRWAALVVLAIGVVLVTLIFATAGWISGVYGQVGSGGAVIFGLVGLLVLPYVVVLPAVELAWLGPPIKAKAK